MSFNATTMKTPLSPPFSVLALILISIGTAAGADRIEPGLYLRTLYFGGSLDISTIYFGPGNMIAFNPKQGTDPFDFEAAKKNSPGAVGTYVQSGGKITVTFASGKTESTSVEFEKGEISAYNGGLVSKADTFKPNTMLNVTYGWLSTTRSVSVSHTLVFGPDGKYTFEHVTGIHHIPGNTGVGDSTESGTYTLSGNTMTLNSASGTAFKHTVIPYNTALDPAKATYSDDHLILDALNLVRQK